MAPTPPNSADTPVCTPIPTQPPAWADTGPAPAGMRCTPVAPWHRPPPRWYCVPAQAPPLVSAGPVRRIRLQKGKQSERREQKNDVKQVASVHLEIRNLEIVTG